MTKDEEIQEAIRQGEFVAARLGKLVDEHPEMQYLGSSILSYGIGLMVGQGSTHDEVLQLCQNLLQYGRQLEQQGPVS